MIDLEDLKEGIELIDGLISEINKHGNYTKDSTIVFLSQIRQCFAPVLTAEEESLAPPALREVPAGQETVSEKGPWHVSDCA